MTEHEDPTDDRELTATEFVTEAFETDVPEGAVESLATIVENAVAELRANVVSDDRLEALLYGEDVLKARDSRESEDPEPLSKRLLIEPLLDELGYPDRAMEAGDLSAERGQQADYSVSLRDVGAVDSKRLLIEAEPLNKPLDQERHGIGQVKDWLGTRQFEADFGIATDGLRWVLLRYDPDTYSFDTLADVDLRPVFVAAFENLTGRRATLHAWLEDDGEDTLADFQQVFGYENFLSIAGDARDVIKEKRREITDDFYDDYVRLVFGIVSGEDEPRPRSLIGDGVVAPESASVDDVRLFAVELMNRLIFIKFLEDKELVDSDLLSKLADAHEEGTHLPSFYKSFLEPLFFDVLDERPDERATRVQDIDIYSVVPYLNGGLFRPSSENGHDFDETAFDVRDSVLLSIVDFLETYSFSADGGPTDLDPSVLGNVFEKTINHITGDAGDQKKELGAYYTPDEITRFCAEQTVQPALLERFADRMIERWGWTEEMADYDDVYDLVDALPDTQTDVIDDLLKIVDQFRALDPACGSGHFLTSVQSEIVAIRKALYEKHDADPQTWELQKQTVIENVYGVDIVSPAVEIAKLRLWLSIIAEVEPEEIDEYDDEELALPNVVFNVRQGNSLIGFTGLVESDAKGINAQLESFTSNNVENKYGDVIELIEKHKQATDTEEALKYLREAEQLITTYSIDLDAKILTGFHEAGMKRLGVDDIQQYSPFHWVLEFAPVYRDGGFDVIVGNPPWDRLRPTRDDFFSRYDPEFQGLMPSEKDARQAVLLADDERGIAEKWEKYQKNIEIQTEYFRSSGAYEKQRPTIDGKIEATENDLSALFLERVCELTNEEGYVAQVLPGSIFNAASTKDLRMYLLNNTTVQSLVVFENHGIFPEVDPRYYFGIVTFKAGGKTSGLRGAFKERDLRILQNVNGKLLDIPKKVLAEYSPAARIFPYIQTQQEVDVLEKIVNHPPIGEQMDDVWHAEPYAELHRTSDTDRFVENEADGDYPVYGGSNVFQYVHDSTYLGVEPPKFWSVDEPLNKSAKYRIQEKNLRKLKRRLYDYFDGSGSQKGFVNDLLKRHRGEPLSESDVFLDCTEYRIVFRDIARASDERTIIAAVIPDGIVCHNTLHTLRPYKIEPSQEDLSNTPLHSVYDRVFTDEELFVALGLINSLPFDYLMRTKVDSHIVMYKFKESQLPRLTEGDEWFEYIWTRAAKLNCYGEPFAEMRERLGGIEPATDPEERTHLQAEIDAAAFHAYGLDREETTFVLDDFHRVQNPRMMTEEYFDLVLEKYDELA